METVDYDGALANAYATHRVVHPVVAERLASVLTPTSVALEVGCGTGNYLRALRASADCDCVGIDPSTAMLAKARSMADPRVRLIGGRAERLELPDGAFDLVFSVDVIHHVHDRPAAFREAVRVMRGGAHACTVTDSESVIRRRLLSRYFPETVDVELARYPSVETLRDEMTAAGLRSIREEEVAHDFEVVDAHPFREKVFSSLLFIGDDAFARGLARLEADLQRGPLVLTARCTMLWGQHERTT